MSLFPPSPEDAKTRHRTIVGLLGLVLMLAACGTSEASLATDERLVAPTPVPTTAPLSLSPTDASLPALAPLPATIAVAPATPVAAATEAVLPERSLAAAVEVAPAETTSEERELAMSDAAPPEPDPAAPSNEPVTSVSVGQWSDCVIAASQSVGADLVGFAALACLTSSESSALFG